MSSEKNTRFLLRILMILFLLPIVKQSSAQCGIALKDVVIKEIGDAKYLKDFRARLPEGSPKKPPTKEFPILLNKGVHYRINVKADAAVEDKVVLKLYDFTKLYGSNYDPTDGTSYAKFDFLCAKTQVYYISLSFAEGKQGCAVGMVSFVKNYDAN